MLPAPPAPPGVSAPAATPAASPVPPAPGPDWVQLKSNRFERAAWVTKALLAELLPETAFQAWTDVPPEAPRAQRVRAVLVRRTPFVALVDRDRRFNRLIDRRELLEEVVRGVEQQLEDGP